MTPTLEILRFLALAIAAVTLVWAARVEWTWVQWREAMAAKAAMEKRKDKALTHATWTLPRQCWLCSGALKGAGHYLGGERVVCPSCAMVMTREAA